MRRARALLFAPLAIYAGCTESVPPHAPEVPGPSSTGPTVNVAASPTETAPVTARPTPVLPPLARDERPPCDVAKDARKAADSALSAGRSYRALKLVQKADRLCLSTAVASYGTKLDALSKLGLDDAAKDLAKEIAATPAADANAAAAAKAVLAKAPVAAPPSGDSLLTAALAAHKNSAADARAQMDRALARLEREASDKARLYVDSKERNPLAISNDGATVAVGDNKTVLLLDAKTLRPQRFFDLAEAPRGAVLSADGKLFATITGSAVDVWSATTGKRAFHLVWTDEEPRAALFSNDGKRLFVGGRKTFDGTLRVWNLETGDSADSFSLADRSGVTALALSRDNKQIAIGTERGTVELWAVSPHKQIATLAKKESFLDEVRSLSFSPKNDRVLSYGRGGKIEAFDVKTAKSLWTGEAESPWSEGAAIFSADGARVVSGGINGFHPTLREWDAATGAELQNKPVSVQAEFFSQDGRYAFGGDRESLGVLDIASGAETVTSNQAIRVARLQFSSPRILLAHLDGDKGLRAVTPSSARYLAVDDPSNATATTLDGKVIAQVGYHGIDAWDVESGARVGGFPSIPDRTTDRDLALAPDGTLWLWTRYFSDFALYTAKKGDPLFKPSLQLGERKDLTGFEVSAFGRYGVLYKDDKLVVLDTATGAVRSLNEDTAGHFRKVDLSADGTALFVEHDRRMTRFDTSTGKATHSGIVVPCSTDRISPSFDGLKVLVACSEEGYLYTFAPGQESPTSEPIKYGRIEYARAALSPHGDLVLTAETDGGLHVWDAHSVQRGAIHFAVGHDATLVVASDGRAAVLGKEASTIEDRLSCRVGSRGMPFVVCADALGDDDLLAEVLAPSN